MDWITGTIAIGSRDEAHDALLREQNTFRGLVSLDGSLLDEGAQALGYDDWLCVSMIDGPGNDLTLFRKIVQALIGMTDDSPPVLVHCHAGRSRSVTVVAAYLVKTRGWSARIAYDFIATKREMAVQAGLPDLLQKFANQRD